MAFTTPTLDEMHEFLIALFSGLFPDQDVSRGSFNWLWLKTLAAGVTDNHAHLDAVENDLMPDTAEGDMQERWGRIKGVLKKGATGARKSKALRVFGTATTAVDAGLELTHASGLGFRTANADIVGPGGYVDMDIAAIDVGSATRLNAGEHLSFVNTPVGLQEDTELQIDMDEGGDDAESPGAYRLRILSRFSDPPLGGAQEDYVQWALSVLGVAAAYCYPLRQGYGSVDVAALHAGSGTDRLLLAPERAALQAVLDKLRPVSVRAFRVLEVIGNTVHVELTFTPDGDASHEIDWDDETPPTVVAWTALTRLLQFSARPADMLPGDRIVIKNLTTPGNSGKERVVESLSGGDSVILEVDETGDEPAAGGTIYAGGPLVQPIRAALIKLFDSLGTANPDANRYGTWEGNVDPDTLGGAARSVSGVRRSAVVTPGGLVEAADPAYPDDGTIELLVPGRILVRRTH